MLTKEAARALKERIRDVMLDVATYTPQQVYKPGITTALTKDVFEAIDMATSDEGAAEHDALKRLLLAFGYGGPLNKKDQPPHVAALVSMIEEMRKEHRKLAHERDAAVAERDTKDPDEVGPCTMAARIDSGHGTDGHCVIMARPCPRACLIRTIKQHQMSAEGRQRDTKIGMDMITERDARIAVLKARIAKFNADIHQLISDSPLGYTEGRIITPNSVTDADVIAWLQRFSQLVEATPESEAT